MFFNYLMMVYTHAFGFFLLFRFHILILVTMCVCSTKLNSDFLRPTPNISGNRLCTSVENLTKVFPDNSNLENTLIYTIDGHKHIPTPEVVKALYISSWVAGTKKYRDKIIRLIDETEINAIVIDIKDATGKISFVTDDPHVEGYKNSENRIRDIKSLIATLHKKNIYIIGRISVFQDDFMAHERPHWALKKKSDGLVWKDKKGLSYLNPSHREVLDYTVAIALASYEIGFDEINFDYIRYPSDGKISDLHYQLKKGESRADQMESFFKNLNNEMKKNENIPISADVFGMATEAQDDLGIGQIWEKTIPYFDFICPMVYPSHYPDGYLGYKNPAEHPYEVVNRALRKAVNKTQKAGENISKIRPWLQDFDLGARYQREEIRAQIKAAQDNQISSWMLWDPRNTYTREALEKIY